MQVRTQLDPASLQDELLRLVDAAHPAAPGAQTLIVVPTTRLAAHLQRRLADTRPAWLGLDVLTFQALATRILDDGDGKASSTGRRTLSLRLREALLQSILDEHPDNGWAAYTRRRPGTLRPLVASIADLREAGVAPDELESAADTAAERDLALLYRATVAALDRTTTRGWTDAAGLVRAALPAAKAWAEGYGAIFVHGAYEWIGVHVELIREMDAGRPTTVLVPAAPGAPVSQYADAFLDRALGGAAAAQPIPGPMPLQQRPDLPALFDEESRPRPGGQFRFHHTQGVTAEVTVAVREALAAVAAGCPPDEIAITARTIEPYVAALEDGLEAHGLPWTSSLQAPLLRQPLARDFLLALRVVGEDFPRAPTAELLRSPRIAWQRLTHDGRTPAGARADGWSRSARILGGLDEWRDGLQDWIEQTFVRKASDGKGGDDDGARLERHVTEARRIGSALGALRDDVRPQARRWDDHARRLADLFDRLFPRDREASIDDDEAPLDATHAAMHDLLDEMARRVTVLDDGRDVPFREMIAWLHDAVRGAGLPLRQSDDGGIRILDAMQLRGLTFRRVHVLGVNSGLLPRPPRRDPILDSGLRGRLQHRFGRPLAGAAPAGSEERLLLAHLLGAASDQVDISWQRADESGRARTPSLALREIARVAFGDPDLSRIDMGLAHWPSHPAHWLETLKQRTGLLTPGEQRLRLALNSAGIGSARVDLGGYPELAAGLEMLAVTQAFHSDDAVTGRAFDAVVGPRPETTLSVSAVDNLGGCPLRFFFSRVLRVREFEDETNPFEQVPREQGTRIHGILERVYATLRSERLFDDGNLDRAVSRARQCIEAERDTILGVLDQRIAARLPVLHERIVERWIETLQAFVAADLPRWFEGQWKPGGFEIVMEQRLQFGGLHQTVHGRMDRTVQREAGLLVGDYKTSASLDRRVDVTQMLKGNALQAPLYALLAGDGTAVEMLGVHPDLDYRDDGWCAGFGGFDDRTGAGIRETLGELFGLLQRGEFPFRSDKHCEWCPYTHACRRHDPPSQERQATSPGGARFERLQTKSSRTPLLKDPKS